jgi:parvulin-like peptidyl-prolyl isomerase
LKRFSIRITSTLSVLALFIATAFTACASAPTAAPVNTNVPNVSNPQQVATTVPNVEPTKEPVAALINGKPLFMSVLDKEVARRMDGIRALGDPVPSNAEAFRNTVLDTLIDQVLIEEAASVQQVKVTDADIEAEIQANIAIAGSKDKLLVQMQADRMTEEEYRAGIRSALLTSKMRDIVTAGVAMTAEQVHARHILVSTEATANEIVTKLKDGSDFAELAAQYSQDTSTRDTGGDLGWFAKGELLEPTVEDTAFSMQANQTSAAIKSKLGYHIIQTLERVKDRPISPETHFKLSSRVFEAWVLSLEKSAKIEKFPNGIP